MTRGRDVGELVLRHDGRRLAAGPFRFTPVGMEVSGEPSFEDWDRAGAFLQQASGSVLWWVGDWLNYGERKWGEMYAQAVAATGYDEQTLRVAKRVAERFELLRRRNNLSFPHHRDVAPLESAEADRLLDQAEAEGLSTRDLRAKVKELKAAAKEPEPFVPLVAAQQIRDWLIAKRDTWPEQFRPAFVPYVVRVLQEYVSDPVDG